jgi:hypothetical protein
LREGNSKREMDSRNLGAGFISGNWTEGCYSFIPITVNCLEGEVSTGNLKAGYI